MLSVNPFDCTDELGPAKVIHLQEPSIGLKGIVVVDNTAAGPAIGGLRMAADASLEECLRLARAMSLKNAAAGLAHGGGKSVLIAEPRLPRERKEELIRAMACAIGDCHDYIVGPDMGTDETCMGWVYDEIGRAVGLPREIGGIPLDEIGATGWGLRHSIEVASESIDLPLDGARVVIQGYGNVGRPAAHFLRELGCVVVAAADSRGAVHAEGGLDLERLDALKAEGQSVGDYEDAEPVSAEELIGVDCEIWIPAARPDAIRGDNADRVRARLVASGANIATTPQAEQRLHERGVLNVPDFIANAGGVICAAMEYHGSTERAALEEIAQRVSTNTRHVLERSKSTGCIPREAAQQLSVERIRKAMEVRRWSIF
ncbi:MAG: Glu/Leu/Phe/Val dehydrogenase [bacterium]|nr:Glu/Leu/Phe/Val dehydrogenase [bacterium]